MTDRKLSVRRSVTMAATSVTLVALALAAVGIVWSQQRVLTERLDRELSARADAISNELAMGTVDLSTGRFPFTQIVTIDGQVIDASPGLVGLPPLAPTPSAAPAVGFVEGIPEPDDKARLHSRVISDTAGRQVLHVGESMDRVDDPVGVAALTLTAAVPLITGLLGWIIWLMVGRTLRPVEAIRAEVSRITLSDLSRRVPQPPGDDEVSRLASTMNDMLATLEEAARRQDRFISDASHELRTPLARMRAEIEVDLAHPETSDPSATQASLLEELTRITDMIDELLLLARSGSVIGRMEPIDLGQLVDDELGATTVPDNLVIDAQLQRGSVMMGDRTSLVRVTRNLIDNAIRHASEGVTVEVVKIGEDVRLSVADDGEGISLADRQRVFERFSRVDEARAQERGGAGLGLAIVREIVTAHKGVVGIDENHHRGTRVLVVFQAAQPES